MIIGLIQIDGDLPNLALMKLSKYHKNKGDEVYLMRDKVVSTRLIQFDKVYISCIFEENQKKARLIQKQFNNAELGGIGIHNVALPKHIEHLMPDYELYDCDYSMGFATRGCIRQCEFCKVPNAEGLIRKNTSIYEFWDRKHKHLVLLDNNILASPKHFEEIAKQIIKEDLSVDFNQGLDIRLLNKDNVKLLAKLNVKPHYRFAFDSLDVESDVLKGLKLLKENNIKFCMWYVLVGFNTTIEQDFYRLDILKRHQQKAYVMRYKDCRGQQIYNDMSSWANQPQFFFSMDFETYLKCQNDRR